MDNINVDIKARLDELEKLKEFSEFIDKNKDCLSSTDYERTKLIISRFKKKMNKTLKSYIDLVVEGDSDE